jgi:ABC-2 type transport system ATP-binding protein
MIEAVDLTKRYGSVTALRGVSFSVPKGQVVGFLGPNGAGKTTTMKILTGYLAPTSGTALVDGQDVTVDPLPAQRKIGYLPEGNPLYGEFRVEEALKFSAEMHGLRGAERDKAIDEAIEAVSLKDKRRRTCGTKSRGERQRVGLAQALLHRPLVLILDEPTSGLDPNQQAEMRSLIRSLGGERTVILSTHILPEVEAVCDRALIVSRGTLVADGTVEEIRAKGSRSAVVAVVRAPKEDAALDAFADLPGFDSVDVSAVADEPGLVRVRLTGDPSRESCERVAARASQRGFPLSTLEASRASLETIFATLTTVEAEAAAETAAVSEPAGDEPAPDAASEEDARG